MVGNKRPDAPSHRDAHRGTVAGDDFAQLYIHRDGPTILQPVRRLNGFQRVTLAPGQTKTITFTLEPVNIGFYTNTRGSSSSNPAPSTCTSATAGPAACMASSP
jgi:hypothetical protein